MEIDVEQLLAPLEGDPCGVEASQIEDLDPIKRELENGEGINRTTVDWKKVVRLSAGILAKKSKHLEVAAYLTLGMLHTRGYQGLITGASVFRGLVVADYWESIHPFRTKKGGRLRAKSMAWLATKLCAEIDALELHNNSDFAVLLEAAEAIVALDKAFRERLEDDAPQTNALLSRLRSLKLEINSLQEQSGQSEQQNDAKAEAEEEKISQRQPEPEKSQTSQESAAESESTTQPLSEKAHNRPASQTTPSFNSIGAVDDSNIDKALKEAQKTIFQLSDYFYDKEGFSANTIYLRRIAGWIIFQDAPVTNAIPKNPGEEIISNLEALLKNDEHEKVLESVESIFKNGSVIHLGLQRLAYLALKGLKKDAAAETLKNTVMQLLSRAPDWLTRHFQEGESFVDEKTRLWLEAMNKSDGSQNNTAGDSDLQQRPELVEQSLAPWLAASTQANQFLVNNDVLEGIKIFEYGVKSSLSERERFYWRLEQAKYAIKAGELNMAINQLEYLNDYIVERGLSAWEPEFTCDILQSLVQAHKEKMKKRQYNPEQMQSFEKLKRELYVLAPLKAMEFE